MTRLTVPLDAQSITCTCMYASVASYVTGQEYSGKLSIVSVLDNVCFKHHFNDCLKESGRIGLFELVMVSYHASLLIEGTKS